MRNHTKSCQVLRSAEEEETLSLCVLTGSYLCLPRAWWEIQRKAISRCPGGVPDVGTPRQEQGKGSPSKKILWPFLMLGTLHAMYTDFSSLCWDSRRPSSLLKTIRCAAQGNWTGLASLGISGPVQLLQFTTPCCQPRCKWVQPSTPSYLHFMCVRTRGPGYHA